LNTNIQLLSSFEEWSQRKRKMKVKYLLAFCAVISVTQAGLPIKDCGSKAGKVNSITLDSSPVGSCTFPRGKDVTVTFELELYEQTSTLKAVVKGDVIVWVPFPLPNNDACTQGVTCPTTPGSTYTFRTTLPIRDDYPKLRLVTQLELTDDQGQSAICVQFPSEICWSGALPLHQYNTISSDTTHAIVDV